MASVLAVFFLGAKSWQIQASLPGWVFLLNGHGRGSAERGDAQMPADAEASPAAQLRPLGTEVVMQDSFVRIRGIILYKS